MALKPAWVECPNCDYEGKPKTYTPGSGLIELVLWICLLIPGLIYSLWRHSARYYGCPECQYKHVKSFRRRPKED